MGGAPTEINHIYCGRTTCHWRYGFTESEEHARQNAYTMCQTIKWETTKSLSLPGGKNRDLQSLNEFPAQNA